MPTSVHRAARTAGPCGAGGFLAGLVGILHWDPDCYARLNEVGAARCLIRESVSAAWGWVGGSDAAEAGEQGHRRRARVALDLWPEAADGDTAGGRGVASGTERMA